MSTGISPLKVIFHLDRGAGTAFDPYCPPHLDSLMARILLATQVPEKNRTLGRHERPRDIRLPLFETTIYGSKIWKASALFMVGEIPEDVRFFRKKFEVRTIDKTQGNINLRSGTFRDHNIEITIRHIDMLVAYTMGNHHRVLQIVRKIKAIGLKHKRGFGRVEGVEVERIEHDWSLVKDGKAMRWLPDGTDLATTISRLVRSKPPYWNMIDRIPCCEVGAPYSLPA